MKTIRVLLLAAALGSAFSASLAAQNFDQYLATVDSFANTIAPALPSAAVMGNTWSDAWIGSFFDVPPHFGAGLSVGAVFLPIEGFDQIVSLFGQEVPAEMALLGDLGVPFPVINLEGRIGGFVLPFDAGVKVGFLPEAADLGDGTSASYLSLGADVRYSLLKENLLLPGISIGVGFNYLAGSIGYNFGTVTLASVDTGSGTVDAQLADSNIKFFWESTAFDAKLHVSKSLLILTPYAGFGATYADSTAGAGFYSTLQIDDGGGYREPTDQEIQDINDATGANLSKQGLEKAVSGNGTITYRIYAGTSLNLTILKLDLQALYNFGDLSMPEAGGSFGANIGIRVQL